MRDFKHLTHKHGEQKPYSRQVQRFIAAIYANHNRSPSVQEALTSCISELKDGDIGLNVGAGNTRLHPSVINFDLARSKHVDCIGRAEHLPFSDGCFSLVVSQETLEHVQYPFAATREMYRTLRPGGIAYCQVPFIIGYHPGPTDYWRFTREGVKEIMEQSGFNCRKYGITVGPATGFYRIAVELVATSAARFFPAAYLPAKGFTALMLFPMKLADKVLCSGEQRDRIAGGYYVIAEKTQPIVDV